MKIIRLETQTNNPEITLSLSQNEIYDITSAMCSLRAAHPDYTGIYLSWKQCSDITHNGYVCSETMLAAHDLYKDTKRDTENIIVHRTCLDGQDSIVTLLPRIIDSTVNALDRLHTEFHSYKTLYEQYVFLQDLMAEGWPKNNDKE